MPYNGTGTFEPLTPPDFPAVAGAVITAAYYNAQILDITGQGLTRALVRDGQSSMTGNLNMGNNKLTNLATPTVATDGTTKAYVDAAVVAGVAAPFGSLTVNRLVKVGAAGAAANSIITDDGATVSVAGALSATGNFSAVGTTTLGALVNTGNGVSTGDAALEVGANRSGSGACFIDLHAVAGTDFETRFLRNAGVNGSLEITNLGTGGIFLISAGAAPIQFLSGGSLRMIINASGQVGIGQTPGAPLDVLGAIRSNDPSAVGVASLVAANTNNTLITTKSVQVSFQGTDTLSAIKNVGLLGYVPEDGNWVGSYLTLQTRSGDVLSEKVRVTGAGNVGINLGAPSEKLSVGGNIAATNAVYCSFNAFSGVVHGQFAGNESGLTVDLRVVSNHALVLYTNNTERMRVLATGNVGIGTTSAAERLTVSGNIAASGFVSAGSIELGYRDLPVAGSLTRGQAFPTAAGVTLTAQTAGNLFTIYNDSAAAITLTESGITLRLAGTTTTGNRTLAARGFANVWYRSGTEAIVSGNVT